MSYLSREANLIDYELKDDKMTLNFDESIYRFFNRKWSKV